MVSRSTGAVGDFVPEEVPDTSSGKGLLHKSDTGRDVSKQAPPATADISAFETALRAALAADCLCSARKVVADAEAVLVSQDRGSHAETIAATPSRAELAGAKAKIAMAVGDISAAHAILVTAIETHPDVAALKTLMAEVMLATGRATDIRSVLHHLGREPVSSHAQPHPETRHSDRKEG